MLLVHSDPRKMLSWFSVLLVAWTITAVILLSAPLFFKLLRRRGLAAIERLMGMILIMISVQMLVTGIKNVL